MQSNLVTKLHLSKNLIIAMLVVFTLSNTGCSQKVSDVDKTSASQKDSLSALRIGVLPAQNPQDQQNMIKLFHTYLEKSLGRRVEFQIAKDYNQTVEWLVQEKLDIAYLGPVTYLEALDRGAKIEPIVATIDKNTGKPWYQACIIVKSESPIKTLQDLRGKRFSFVDKSSTSGYLMPLASFKKLGIKPEQDFAKILYAGNHSKSMAALEDGVVDASATNISSYLKRQKSSKLTSKNTRIIWKSDPIPQSPIVVSKKLGSELIEKLKTVYVNTPENIEDITGTESAGYTLVSDSDYISIKKLRQELNLVSTSGK